MRNPTWTRDELILALDVYFRVDMRRASEATPQVIELSTLLNRLPLHPVHLRTPEFRNPRGVHMKLRNFCRFDPAYPGAGLGRGGHLEEIVWGEFSANVPRLHETARAIREGYESLPVSLGATLTADEEDNDEFLEGLVLTKLHKRRERSAAIVKRKKRQVLLQAGKLACEACGFDFAAFYGDLGDGYAECHHLVPLAQFKTQRATKLSDLAIVCANCHRMLHRSREWLSIPELRRKVLSARRSAEKSRP